METYSKAPYAEGPKAQQLWLKCDGVGAGVDLQGPFFLHAFLPLRGRP